MQISTLWKAPEINPINGKARSIPILNPFNKYGLVFHFGWFGFMMAFLAWYAFPPLLTVAIKKDLNLSNNEVANSNIIALVATLLVRLVAGPACDRFGPKITFAACLIIGAIPSGLAGTAQNARDLYVIRFFIGILGGSFVPCQVWSTGFFDKNVVGTSNALAAGWGNAGGGITYFVMPAIFDSLMKHNHESLHVAWRVSYVIPTVIIICTAIAMLVLCPDTPLGKWSERNMVVQHNLQAHGVHAENIVAVPGNITDRQAKIGGSSNGSEDEKRLEEEANISRAKHGSFDHEATMDEKSMLNTARGEIVVKPSFKEAMHVIFSPQTAVTAFCYFCTFGAELSINSILGAYYLKQFPKLGQTGTGRFASIFGLLNVVFRPLGGIFSDFLYRKTGSVWAKKIWLHTLSIMTGVFLIIIGTQNPTTESEMFGLIAGMAFFLEAANGANFSLVPHVHPFANGIVSGVTGAAGNFGGVIFAIIFRYQTEIVKKAKVFNYGKSFWILGVMTIGINLAVCWIKPIPKGQVGGR